MDFNDSLQEAEFRTRARKWLQSNAPEFADPTVDKLSEDQLVSRALAWQKRKSEAGYAAITWPVDIGGAGGSSLEAMVFAEEEARYDLPLPAFIGIGMSMAIPTIRKHGSPEQLQRFAKRTLEGDLVWCQLFSEPGAGSDLANVTTRAVRQGDNWVISGQKVWSSWAHRADWGILLARTNPDLPKHKGLSFFVLDMRSHGIDVRPIKQISGASDFNETFLTDVVVSDSCRIGAEGEGWACAMTTLMSERLASGGKDVSLARKLVDLANSVYGDNGASALDSSALREKIATLYVREQGLRHFKSRVRTRMSQGKPVGAEVALAKLVYANNLQQGNALAMDIEEYDGLFLEKGCEHRAQFHYDYIWSTAMRVAGGADEVLRNQLAERVLGMPGEIRMDKNVPFRDAK